MQTNSLKLVEFVFLGENTLQPYVGLFDALDISNINQFDQNHCILIKKDTSQYKVCGTLRTITNRWIYSLEKRIKIYEDDIMRPSISIIHNPKSLGVDNVYFDRYQLENFIQAIKPEVLNEYPEILNY